MRRPGDHSAESSTWISFVYMALEDIVVTDLRHRWLISGMFGLVHGFGFSYAFKEGLQFAGSHALVALLSFNVGIQLGQIAVLLVALPALRFLLWRPQMSRAWVIILSALPAHTGWHRTLDRGANLWLAQWPALDAATVVTGARWAVAALLIQTHEFLLPCRVSSLPARLGRRLGGDPKGGPESAEMYRQQMRLY